MVLYFSGTGNSRNAAQKIAEQTQDGCLDLFQKIRDGDYSAIHSERPIVVVCPIYAWRIPNLLRDHLQKAELSGSQKVYFVVTCGSDTGNVSGYLKQLCQKWGWEYAGDAEVVMPGNYIALFEDVSEEAAVQIIRAAAPTLEQIAAVIRSGKPFPEKQVSMKERILSGAVCDLFYALLVKDKAFRVTDSCIGCGKCARGCVLNNIEMVEGRPVWQGNCTHCMACIDGCPKDAIEYGKSTKGKVRYKFPSNI